MWIAGMLAEPGTSRDSRLLRAMTGILAKRDRTEMGITRNGRSRPRASGGSPSSISPPASSPCPTTMQRVDQFNGEIYNYRALRRELESGLTVSHRSDTEVIIKATRLRPDCVGHLAGMFAFALWDARRRSLFPSGTGGHQAAVSTWNGRRLLFASE